MAHILHSGSILVPHPTFGYTVNVLSGHELDINLKCLSEAAIRIPLMPFAGIGVVLNELLA